MIRKGIQNYIASLKFIFTPLGVLALGVVIGLSVLIPVTISAVRELAEAIVEITGNASVNVDALRECLQNAFGGLDWGEPTAAINTIVNGDWLNTTIRDFLNTLLIDLEGYSAQISEAVDAAAGKIGEGIAVLVVWIVLGLIGGYMLTRALVRKTMARRTLFKYLFALVIDSLLTAGLLVLVVWLKTLWSPSVYLSAAVVYILLGFYSLIEAYLVHGRKRVSCKTVVNLKNVLKLWLTNLIVFLISCVIAAIILAVANIAVGLFLVIPLAEITIVVISLNAEGYVKDLADASEQGKAA
ncbi:MAG: hypothetical protein K2H43_05595 [Clostridia bacterium]|nr:hypothetical protein [Clostridia bacterium]